MKLLQEMRGFADITQRRPAPRQPGFILVQLRTKFGPTSQPRRKLTISVDMQDPPDIPHPVKIKYLPSGSESLPPD
jgi:hypothetical protein